MASSTPLDLRAYCITGPCPDAAAVPEIAAIAAAAAEGGAGVVQVRSKPIDAGLLLELTRAVARAVAAANPHTRVLVDDRVDVALALRAAGEPVHGVHLGHSDLPVALARELLGEDAIIGLTTGTAALLDQAHAVAEHIDYVGCGPLRATPTKDSGRPPIGLDGYRELIPLSPVPLVAIGDVQLADAAPLAAAGCAGVAIVRGFHHAGPAGAKALARDVVAAFEEQRA